VGGESSSNYASYFESGIVLRPMGTAVPTVVPYRSFHTRNRTISIAVESEKLWPAFCGALGRPELAKHPDYHSNAARIRNRGVLEPLLEGAFRERFAAEWMRRMRAAGISASLVQTFREVAEHPQCEVGVCGGLRRIHDVHAELQDNCLRWHDSILAERYH
jgi:crotonobetainyl-CoA:carnitine CoA-transferase CaiB-like acyl-CoA transferase